MALDGGGDGLAPGAGPVGVSGRRRGAGRRQPATTRVPDMYWWTLQKYG